MLSDSKQFPTDPSSQNKYRTKKYRPGKKGWCAGEIDGFSPCFQTGRKTLS